MTVDRNRVLSVGEFNAAARQVIESALPLLWVRGEISNFVSAASGHWYFSLKDEQAQVRCVMFRHKSQYLDFKPANGMSVEVLALPTLYEARGDFQLTLERMRPAGLGALYEAFEKLKRKLEQEGLFAVERKRGLPFFPHQVGVVTSPQAAALRDVLRTLAKRMPGIPVVLYPVPVQGEEAAQKIAAALQLANQRAECDVLILCRGGGSMEDLWAFNEEVVARALAASAIPVISGVGHETDFTIADFAADLRAATPTAAAQAAVPDCAELRQRLRQDGRRMSYATLRHYEQQAQRLDYLQRRLVHPAQRIRQQRQHLAQLQQRLGQAQGRNLEQQRWRWQGLHQKLRVRQPAVAPLRNRLATLAQRLDAQMSYRLQHTARDLDALQLHLQHLDPQRVLQRGYSLVRDGQGQIVRDSAQLAAGMALELTLAQGWARAEVTEAGKNKTDVLR